MKNKYREKPADTDRPMVRKRGKKMDEFRELLEEIWGIYDIILWKEDKTTMKQNIEELRKKYMDNPPGRYDFQGHSPYERGWTSGYGLFLKWWWTWWRFWWRRFLYLLNQHSSACCARWPAGPFQFKRAPAGGLSYKGTKSHKVTLFAPVRGRKCIFPSARVASLADRFVW